jgi:hypothetical protein
LALLGKLALVEADHDQAQRHLADSIGLATEGSSDSHELGQLAWLGLAARGLGRRTQARQRLMSSLGRTRGAQQFIELMVTLAGIALLLADEGEMEEAVELYALVSRYPLVAKSQWFSDVIGRHIAEAAATLPEEMLLTARERGRARDLEATVVELLETRSAWQHSQDP